MELSEEQKTRYGRHLVLEGVGEEGQKLLEGRVLIVGAGGLGSPVAMYLAAAGVGTIGIVDGDMVDLSNLQRQVIHRTRRHRRPKVESAKERMLSHQSRGDGGCLQTAAHLRQCGTAHRTLRHGGGCHRQF